MSAHGAVARLRALAKAPGPDAELIRLCERHPDLIHAFNNGGEESADDSLLWTAYERSRDAIAAARPVTFAGMVAKALAAKAEAASLDGEERPQGTPAEDWAWDLVNDLCRLESLAP